MMATSQTEREPDATGAKTMRCQFCGALLIVCGNAWLTRQEEVRRLRKCGNPQCGKDVCNTTEVRD